MKYLILADIHGNLPALEAVLEKEADWDELVFLGDAIDAGPFPNEVLSTLSDLHGLFIMGNHDREIPESANEPPDSSRDFVHWSNNQLSAENREFIRGFTDDHRLSVSNTELSDIRLHHGDFSIDDEGLDWDGRLWPDTDHRVYANLADRFEESIVLFGHSHVQFEQFCNGTRFINPGSVGQHRLKRVRAAYAVLEDGVFRLRETDYDVERIIQAVNDLPLQGDLIKKKRRTYTEGVLETVSTEFRDFGPLRSLGYQ